MTQPTETRYDVTIIGAGHNGLVAACYLAKAGMSVLVLERNADVGGATRSAKIFDGVDAKLSIYSYLVSLFPDKIVSDLDLNLRLRSRKTASWTPAMVEGKLRELLIRNNDPSGTRDAFLELTGDGRDYEGYCQLQEMEGELASVIWPSLTSPLVTREEMRGRLDKGARRAWQALVEEPLGEVIERQISSDLIRGLVFTDAKIGVSTFPHDASLLQNRVFLYHIIGRGSGEWLVPVGGMGAVVDELVRVARDTGRVTIATGARVRGIGPGKSRSSVEFEIDGLRREVDSRFVLCNASASILGDLTGGRDRPEVGVEGSVFKVNMLLERLPRLRSDRCSSAEAFAGTFHIDEGYEQMLESYRESMGGVVPAKPPGEVYCHTLTDDSILSDALNRRSFHTLTLFGIDMPYALFQGENTRVRNEVLEKYLSGINQFLDEPIESCLAKDANGEPCIEAKSPVDLENEIHLPRGNIFHGDLTWPFTDVDGEVGRWGVETEYPNILLCGSAAKRGGCVSGIPGHNAAMKVLEMTSGLE